MLQVLIYTPMCYSAVYLVLMADLLLFLITLLIVILKALDILGKFQRPLFSLGVSKHNALKTQRCESFDSNWSSKLQENNE